MKRDTDAAGLRLLKNWQDRDLGARHFEVRRYHDLLSNRIRWVVQLKSTRKRHAQYAYDGLTLGSAAAKAVEEYGKRPRDLLSSVSIQAVRAATVPRGKR